MSALSVEILPEYDLIEATRDGDDRAFEELYSRYQERITAFIRSRVRDHGRAEDVAQEVFISALRRLRASAQQIAFKPWIYEIAKNACIDEYRRSLRGREVPLDDGAESAPAARLLSTAPTPPAAVEAKERLSDLRGAFGVLSENHHQLIVMREFEGLSYDEIGARTGMSRPMVESALFRARRKLTEEYEELASGRRCLQIQSAIEAGRASCASSLGIRERRRFARHLAHCQPCRTHAQLGGVDTSLLVTRTGLQRKIAALLPFPLLRWPWAGRRARAAVAEVGSHPEALHTLHRASEPAAATSLGGAAVAAAVLALAGTGAVVAPELSHGRTTTRRPAAVAATVGRGAAVRAAVAPVAGSPAVRPPALARLQMLSAAKRLTRVSETPARRAASHRRSAAGSTHVAPAAPGGSGVQATAHSLGLPSPGGTPPSPGGAVRATGGALTGTMGAATDAVVRLTGSLPVSGTVSSLGGGLTATTRSVTGSLASGADAITGAVNDATAAASSAESDAAAASSGAIRTLRGVVDGLTGSLTGR